MRAESERSAFRSSARGPHYHIWTHVEGPIPSLDFDYCKKCMEVMWRTIRK